MERKTRLLVIMTLSACCSFAGWCAFALLLHSFPAIIESGQYSDTATCTLDGWNQQPAGPTEVLCEATFTGRYAWNRNGQSVTANVRLFRSKVIGDPWLLTCELWVALVHSYLPNNNSNTSVPFTCFVDMPERVRQSPVDIVIPKDSDLFSTLGVLRNTLDSGDISDFVVGWLMCIGCFVALGMLITVSIRCDCRPAEKEEEELGKKETLFPVLPEYQKFDLP